MLSIHLSWVFIRINYVNLQILYKIWHISLETRNFNELPKKKKRQQKNLTNRLNCPLSLSFSGAASYTEKELDPSSCTVIMEAWFPHR